MSRRPDYIPPKLVDFNKFQTDLHLDVVTNATQWGIPALLVSDFTTWHTNHTALYMRVSNKDKRTKEDLDNYRAFQKDYIVFLRALVQGSLVNNALIPIGTRGSMGLNPRGLSPRQPKEKISTVPLITLSPLGGGMIRFNFKVDTGSKIAHMHPDSNGLAIYYRFTEIGGSVPNPPTAAIATLGVAVDAKGDPIQAADNNIPRIEGFELHVSTKAQFIRQMGVMHIGQMLHVFAQWINSSKPENNGNYSMVTAIVIS